VLRPRLQVRRKLMNTRRRMEEMLQGNVDGIISTEHSDDWYASEEELAQPLLAVYW
jgi:DNA-binding LacI/PurR family transcriptional regulator